MSKRLEQYLNKVQGIYHGENDRISENIARVLMKMPEEACDYIVGNCSIVQPGLWGT